LFVFIGVEGRRLALRNLWVPVVATCVVGVSLGFPLFLYMRQLKLDAQSNHSSGRTLNQRPSSL
jgi:hypothetical protein